ncbi:MAG: hypothetical protein IJ491_06665 [Clostridia bacterium]|nr:hypothetical protein [Clostridia bacterium]
MHKDFWSTQNGQSKKSLPPKKRISDSGFSDPDTAILLPLILLLMSDGGDEILIMALIYILS